jgi:hypothetical protein
LNTWAAPIAGPVENTNLSDAVYYRYNDNGYVFRINDGTTHNASNLLLYSNQGSSTLSNSGLVISGSGSRLEGSNISIYKGILLDASGNALDKDGNITTDPAQFVLRTDVNNSGIGMYVNAGSASINGLTLRNHQQTYIVNLANNADVELRNVDISGGFGSTSAGLPGGETFYLNNSRATVTDGTITGGGNIIVAVDNSFFTGSGLTITRDETGQFYGMDGNASAIRATNDSSITLRDSVVNAGTIRGVAYSVSGGASITATNVQATAYTGINLVIRRPADVDPNTVKVTGRSLDVTGELVLLRVHPDAIGTPAEHIKQIIELDGVKTSNGGKLINSLEGVIGSDGEEGG